MYLVFFVILFIMAGFGFDDDNFSLSGLTQEGHEYDVTTINSSTDDENYDGLLQCARKLTGENLKGASRQVSSHLSSHVSSQLSRICRFVKQLIVDYFFQTAWHLLCHIQTNRLM